jgi:hypothetical protein
MSANDPKRKWRKSGNAFTRTAYIAAPLAARASPITQASAVSMSISSAS